MRMAVNEKLLHTSIFVYNLAILIRISMIGNFNEVPEALSHLYVRFNSRYLTKWTFVRILLICMLVVLSYYACMVLVHLIDLISGNIKSSYRLRRFADSLFTIIVIPTGLFITIGFWIVYYIERDLIFPPWLEQIIPGWVNHGVHTFNSVLPVADLLLAKHTFPPWSEAVFGSLLYFGSYILCLFGTYFQHGFWLYPIFETMTLLQSFLSCVGVIALALALHHVARVVGLTFGTSVVETKQKEMNHDSKKVS